MGVLALTLAWLAGGGRHVMGEARAAALPLPPPQTTGGLAVEAAIAARRSVRRLGEETLKLAEVGQVLWAAQGLTDRRGYRAAPSAGALYPLELHLVAGSVDGLTAGTYRYLPQEHALIRTVAADRREAIGEAALGQGFLRRAPALLAICALPARTAAKYGARSDRYVCLEAGHAAQNVCLQALSLGLGTVPVGAFRDEPLRSALALPGGEIPLYLMPLGRPAASPQATFSNRSLPALHTGQSQSSGRSSKAVPGGMPASGSPTAGSYT
jgi:SagB-type dehydrogenase family enzyme